LNDGKDTKREKAEVLDKDKENLVADSGEEAKGSRDTSSAPKRRKSDTKALASSDTGQTDVEGVGKANGDVASSRTLDQLEVELKEKALRNLLLSKVKQQMQTT